VNVVTYFMERFWTMKDFTSAQADKVITGRAVNRFKITARLARVRRQAGQRNRSLAERTKGQDDMDIHKRDVTIVTSFPS
jgi:hypothetical protein